MSIVSADYIRPAKRLGLNTTPMWQALEGASQTFKRGDPLIASSGYLVTAAADPVSVIVGFAAEDGHNDSSAGTNSVLYWPALPNVIFEGVLYHSSASSAKIAQTDLFAQYGLVKSSTALIWTIDKTESSAAKKQVRVVGFKEAVGQANGKVYFVVNNVASGAAMTVWG